MTREEISEHFVSEINTKLNVLSEINFFDKPEVLAILNSISINTNNIFKLEQLYASITKICEIAIKEI